MKVGRISRETVLLHEVSVRCVSGPPGFELNVEQLRTLPTVERFWSHRQRAPMLCESQTCRRLGGGPHGPCDSPGPPRTGDPVALPVRISFRTKVLSLTGTPLDQCTCRGVLASDASLSGYGATQFLWSISDVSAMGRIPEVRRWRFDAVLARRHAFESAGFQVHSRNGEVLRDGLGRPISLHPEMVRNNCV